MVIMVPTIIPTCFLSELLFFSILSVSYKELQIKTFYESVNGIRSSKSRSRAEAEEEEVHISEAAIRI